MTSFSGQLSQVVLGWNYIKNASKESSIVLMGDSNGASLGLALLLHIARPAYRVSSAVPVKPDAAIFISPVCRSFNQEESSRDTADYMQSSFFKRYGKLMQASTLGSLPQGILHVYESPGLCKSREWWTKAVPQGGVFFMHGDEEVLSPEIDELYHVISRVGHCRIAASRGQLHSWPLFQMIAGRTIEDREQGIEDISVSIGHMILWKDMSLVEREEKFEELVLKKLKAASFL